MLARALCLLLLRPYLQKHACSHSYMQKPPLLLMNELPFSHLLSAQASANPIFRVPNVLFETAGVDSVPVAAAHKDLVKGVLLPRLGSWVRELVRVSGPQVISALPVQTCYGMTAIPARYNSAPTNADLLIFVSVENNPAASYVAQATTCMLSNYDRRPVVGFMRLNVAQMPLAAERVEEYVRVAMHELLHILGISADLFGHFPHYPNGSAVQRDAQRTFLVTRAALAFAGAHFGCTGLPGVPLEDEGGSGSAGSHFERRLFGNEMMTSQVGDEMVLSGLTLAVLYDSGWYQPGPAAGEQLWWGRGAGCDFCSPAVQSNHPEFCARPGQLDCTGDYRSGTTCAYNTFANSLLIKRHQYSYFCDQVYAPTSFLPPGLERRGAGSRCFNVSSFGGQAFGCFPSSCTPDGSILLLVGNTWQKCGTYGQHLSVAGFSVACPDPARFCAFLRANKCPSDCSGYGYCRDDGTCKCRVGYAGPTCALQGQTALSPQATRINGT